ncbi:hypothetical protein HBN71_07675 [Pseudomonas lundensis]|uniref:hypothetical protein n=1 Tax=Pseudomonas TaxID=286 RepID=UPI001473481A|nr:MULTISPECIES: hypothetical protein [Pseudomonas]NNA11062.1 hypothetical protein [Pseudomonas lundensis]
MSNTLITWAAFYPSLGGHTEAAPSRPEKICATPDLAACAGISGCRSSVRSHSTVATQG